jgi:putative MATE family efflux protein
METAMNATTETVPSRAASAVAATPRAAGGGRAAMMEAALRGKIVPTMLRLGLPTLVVLVAQTLVGVAETYFVSFLGTDALAGVALVFPVLMLMQMMANGGIGGGVASAIARAIGAGRRDDADALALHALLLGVAFGLVFMLAAWLGGSALYRAMGGSGASLAAALTYSNIIFLGAVPLWVTALLGASLRGAGDVRAPARVSFVGFLILVPLSPALIFGWGPLPRLGIAGAGTAVLLYYAAASLVLIAYLRRGRAPLRLGRARIERRLLRQIMTVGGLSAIGTVQANLTVALLTGAVGLSGVAAIAGYGIASRLDYLLIPLLFGFGTGVVTMVGANVGAGQIARARRIAWIGAAIGGGATGLIGLAAALFPQGWTGIFTDAPEVLATSALYLRTVAPFYLLYGAGMMLYFASQGANRVLLLVLAGTARLLVAGLGGWLAASFLGIDLGGLFAIAAASSALFGLISIGAVAMSDWGEKLPSRR